MTGGGAPAGATPYWTQSADALFASLHSSRDGLRGGDAARQRERVGANVVRGRAAVGTVTLLLRQFTTPIMLLLLATAGISLAVGDHVDGATVIGILVVSGLLGFWQEHRAQGAVAHLLALIRTTTRTLRDGAAVDLPLEDVVPGDVVLLAAGDSVAGDGVVLEARDLYVDESALTGESYPAEKGVATTAASAPLAARTNALFLGTHVVSGTARMLVVATGARTEFGRVAQRLAARPPETEFEQAVRRFGQLLLQIAVVLVVVVFAVNVYAHRPVLEALLFTLALGVGLAPELLPAIVSVTLSHGARRLARDRVIVRRLAAIADLGGMDVLCTDKTGTITAGVVAMNAARDWRGAESPRALLFAYLNARFETGYANPIDESLRRLDAPAAADRYAKEDEVPYDFVRRRLSVAVSDGTRRLLLVKGALPAVLDACAQAEDAAGTVVPLDEVRDAVARQHAALSAAGHRCLGIAYRPLPGNAPVSRDDERALTFTGILAFADPLKDDAVAALAELGGLGVRVKIVTGDNRLVAAHVAAQVGLAGAGVVTGTDVHAMNDAALRVAADRADVFAEIEPNQKERIIRALRKTGHAVGYLGDGINDSAALHAADVGISVDTASDVTRQAADVVLLEKDLAVLARGVREGRRAFANTLKYIFVTTSANFGNMFSMAGASLLVAFLPLLPKQVLLVNLLTDWPAAAIAADRLDPELVSQPTRWRTDRVRRVVISFGLVSSVFDYMTFALLLLIGATPAVFRTGWFSESVLSELIILLIVRTTRPFWRSRPGSGLLWISALVAVIVLVLPYAGIGAALGFAPPPFGVVAALVAVVLLYAVVNEAIKRRVLGAGALMRQRAPAR